MRTHSGIISSSEQSLLPQFLSAVTFEFQRLTEDGTTVDPSDGLRHGNVRIGEPREPVLRFSSRLLLVRNPDYTGISSLGVGLGFRRDRRGSTQVLQVYFAAVRDSLDVAAPGDFSSAIKPKVSAVLAMEARDGLYTRDKAERLILVSDHLFEIMIATGHLPVIAGDASGQSSNTQCAS